MVLAGAAAVLVLVVGILVWFTAFRGDAAGTGERTTDRGRQAADAFAGAWQAGKLTPALFTTGQAAVSKTVFITAGLTPDEDDHPSNVAVTAFDQRPAAGDGPERGVATFRVTWNLGPGRTWAYDTKATVEEATPTAPGKGSAKTTTKPDGPTWQMVWTPSLIESSLVDGEVLAATRVAPLRGDVLGPDGQSLTGGTGKVEVGIQPKRAPDPVATARTVAGLLKVDPDAGQAGPGRSTRCVRLGGHPRSGRLQRHQGPDPAPSGHGVPRAGPARLQRHPRPRPARHGRHGQQGAR